MKNNDVTRDLQYYQSLPYGVLLRRDEEGDWVAKIEELPGCTAHGGTQAEALENLEEVKSVWLEDALAAGGAVPEPISAERLPSGKWLQRVPRSLHKGLAEMAEREGVSLNQLVTSILAEASGRRVGVRGITFQTQPEESHWSLLSSAWDHHGVHGLIDWEVEQQKPTFKINLVDALCSPISALPNNINETHFKVVERANKKELAFKA